MEEAAGEVRAREQQPWAESLQVRTCAYMCWCICVCVCDCGCVPGLACLRVRVCMCWVKRWGVRCGGGAHT